MGVDRPRIIVPQPTQRTLIFLGILSYNLGESDIYGVLLSVQLLRWILSGFQRADRSKMGCFLV